MGKLFYPNPLVSHIYPNTEKTSMNNYLSDFESIANRSHIEPTAKIGKNVQIGPFCYIGKNVEIDDGTWVGPNVTIFEGARIGKHCKIFPGAVIAGIPQDLKFKGEETTVEIGDYTTIREYVTVNRGTAYNWKTVVGSHCLLMAYVHVAHDCVLGDHVILANNVNLAGHVKIDDYAILEGLVAVQQFVHIGMHSFVAGGSLVRKNIPPYVKAAREPLSYIGINAIGLKRRGFEETIIRDIHEIYRQIFVNGHALNKSLEIVESTISPSKERDNVLSFIRNSPKGIMKGFYSLSSTNGHKNNGQSNGVLSSNNGLHSTDEHR